MIIPVEINISVLWDDEFPEAMSHNSPDSIFLQDKMLFFFAASILFSVLIVYGIHTGTNQSYGYVFAVFSTVFCALGACLSLVQMHRSSMLGDVDKDWINNGDSSMQTEW